MEPITTSLTVATVLGVVKAIAAYLAASKGAEKAGEIAGEELAEAGSSALIEFGRSAWKRIQDAVSGQGDEAAETKAAITGFEAAPGSEAWQSMLATQLQSLAATDSELRKLLDELAAQIKPIAGGITSTINMSGNAHADQVAGVNQGSMVYNTSSAKQE